MPSRVGRKRLLLSWWPGNVGIARGPGQAEARVATIVVVEDEPATLRLIAALLGAKGHRVVTLADGAALAATVRAERPALVLLDLGLPGKDGFALLAELRGQDNRDRAVDGHDLHFRAGRQRLGRGVDIAVHRHRADPAGAGHGVDRAVHGDQFQVGGGAGHDNATV